MPPTTRTDSTGDPRQEFYDSLTTIDRNADVASLHALEGAMYTLSSGSIDRARASADTVQKSSAAIATLYTGILALVFSVTNKPLPLRGALTPVFLGAAVVLAAIYLAYLGPVGGEEQAGSPVAGPEPKTYQRIALFIKATSTIATRRSAFLRASVVALGVGLAFIPAPLVTLGHIPTTSKTVPTTPAWPTPAPLPQHGRVNPQDTIRYQAEVTEVANLRSKITNAPSGVDAAWDVWTLLGGLAVGTGIIAAVTRITKPKTNP